MRPLTKVLIANRGEIAVRIIRALREEGVRAVAVFSDVDRESLHVRLADEAYLIGGARPRESYLSIEKLVRVATESGCDAVHPGYGFLAENPEFVEAVEAAGMIFVGPTAATMRLLGDKVAARWEAEAAGVPVVPGGADPIKSHADLRTRADAVGYPLILKAAAGGGGKGIRVVRQESELVAAFDRASSEAQTAFGNSAIYVERFLQNTRHIEVQLLGDGRGNVVHLGERECSLQRRHQK
ncbi:MAG: biotin carboxylase N-terminal domain-containing protein, partial [Planctomycetota bacterium]